MLPCRITVDSRFSSTWRTSSAEPRSDGMSSSGRSSPRMRRMGDPLPISANERPGVRRNKTMVQDLGKTSDGGQGVARLPEEFLQPISDTTKFEEPEAYKGSIGRTMFDTPGAEDGSVTVLLP